MPAFFQNEGRVKWDVELLKLNRNKAGAVVVRPIVRSFPVLPRERRVLYSLKYIGQVTTERIRLLVAKAETANTTRP